MWVKGCTYMFKLSDTHDEWRFIILDRGFNFDVKGPSLAYPLPRDQITFCQEPRSQGALCIDVSDVGCL